MRAIIYTKTICPYCQMAKQYLSEHGVTFTEVVFDDDDERLAMYEELALPDHQRTVPQVFIVEPDGTQRRIGGYSDLLNSDVAAQMAIGDFKEDF
jgi:glutaredoxin 3